MSKYSRPKYDSSRDRDSYTFHPGRPFSLNFIDEPGVCRLYALDDRQVEILREMLAVFPKYHWIWGLSSPRSEWDVTTQEQWEEISTFVEELEAVLVSGCQLELFVNELKRLNAIVAGESVTLEDELGDPVVYDYTETGLVPTFNDLLHVDRIVYADMNVSEVLFEGLVGRKYEGLPLPFEGVGLADITDEQLQMLHERFRMADSSIFNPLTDEKNIVEALETLLRTDKLSDLELLTPNVSTVLNQVFKLENDNPLILFFQHVYAWIMDEDPPELPEYNTVAELLLLIARALQKIDVDPEGSADTISDAIEAFRTTFETRSIAETTADNTNTAKLEAVINAIEDVLGGDFEPEA